MAERTITEEMGRELQIKTALWGPALAGAVVAGPVGFFAGLVAGVAIIVSGGSDTANGESQGNGDRK